MSNLRINSYIHMYPEKVDHINGNDTEEDACVILCVYDI